MRVIISRNALWMIVFVGVVTLTPFTGAQQATSLAFQFSPQELQTIKRNYQDTIAKLTAIIATPIPQDELEATERFLTRDSSTIWALGQLRAIEAAEPIVAYLPQHRIPIQSDQDSLNAFPAAVALVSIGSPAVPHVLKRLERPCTELELRLAGTILFRIDGQDLGRLRLQLVLENMRGSAPSGKPSATHFKNLEDLYSRFNTPGYFEGGRNSPSAELTRIMREKYPPKKRDK